MRTLMPYRLNTMHASLQFRDSKVQKTQDLEDLFRRAFIRKVAWITGTEAGRAELAREHRPILHGMSDRYGYRLALREGNDSWIAVDKDLISGNWSVDYEQIIASGKGHGERGPISASFDATHDLGGITVIACHYLTKDDPRNRDLTKAIGRVAAEAGAGVENTVFYGGDQNIVDRTRDTFMGVPLTSAWDELKKWESTGHGNIDVMASYDADQRVSAVYCRALDDKEFFQHGDHFVVEAGFDILPFEPELPKRHFCPDCGRKHLILN